VKLWFIAALFLFACAVPAISQVVEPGEPPIVEPPDNGKVPLFATYPELVVGNNAAALEAQQEETVQTVEDAIDQAKETAEANLEFLQAAISKMENAQEHLARLAALLSE
jgi:hypothetical protein